MSRKLKLSPYQSYIAKSRYARWIPEEKRREDWEETVDRYLKFFGPRIPKADRTDLLEELREAILDLNVMGSMRAIMTAGEALEKDNCAGYNCSYVAVDDPRAFDEAMYISMCFHPDTLIRVKGGVKPLNQIEPGDLVLSKDDEGFFYQPVMEVVTNPTEQSAKLELEFADGSKVKCTEDHEFLTQRGYVSAKNLQLEDDIVEEACCVYLITNLINKKIYIGYTSQSPEKRFEWHCNDARSGSQLPLHRAIRKYGPHAFSVEALETLLSLEVAKEREQHHIKTLESCGPNGYNCTLGGEGTTGYRWTNEQKANKPKPSFTEEFLQGRSLWMKEYNGVRIFTPNYRQHLSDAQMGEKNHQYGKPKTPGWKKERSEENSGENNPFFDKHHTNKAKEANSKAHKGKHLGENNPSARSIVVRGQSFSHMKQAITELGLTYNKLYKMIETGEAHYATR